MSIKSKINSKNILVIGCCNNMCSEATKKHSGFVCQSSFFTMRRRLSGRGEVFTCKYIEHGDRCPFTL